jgi:uncharacterized protein YjgD (DUF1641 family)
VGFEGGFELATHDREAQVLRSQDGRSLPYDFAVMIPSHQAPEVIRNSPLAAANGYMDVVLPSMQSPLYENVYGSGDVVAPTIGLGMAGVFAHFQADHVATEIMDDMRGAFMGELYNMVGVCVMDTGYMGAAVWCDFTDKLYGWPSTPIAGCSAVCAPSERSRSPSKNGGSRISSALVMQSARKEHPVTANGSTQLSDVEREAYDAIVARVAQSSDGLFQALDLVDSLADSGTLAALNAIFEDFDENFSALTRPDLMGMVANLMMVMGVLSQLKYEPFFNLAMHTAPDLNKAYDNSHDRPEKMSMREMMGMMRSPEFASAMRTLDVVLKSQQGSPN